MANNGFIYGNLSKSRDERHKIVSESDTTAIQELRNATYNSLFLYDPVNEILLFEDNSRIDRDSFVHFWARLVYQGDPTIGDIIVITFPVEEDLYHKVKGMEVLTRIEFEIVPPNMINKKVLGTMRDLIHDANGTKIKYVAENKKGLNKDGPFIDSGIEMIKNAYGYVKVSSYDTFKTKGKGGKTRTSKNDRSFRSLDSVFYEVVRSTNTLDIIEELKHLWQRAKTVVRVDINDQTENEFNPKK